ncbi:MAG: transcription termination factor NusA [Verrucomicrobiae bacterium]|nr:transcription termination factor NusA [Verrucomicrobiae bacterium]
MNGELITLLDYYEREKGIDRATMIKALEEGIIAAALKGREQPTRGISVSIDPKSGEIRASAKLIVVEAVKDPQGEIPVLRARRLKPDARAGDEIEYPLVVRDFGRIATQTARQSILQRQRSAEKERIFVEFKDRVGDIVSGTVRRFDKSDVFVDLGRFEARLPSRERVSTEDYQINERLRAYVLAVENQGHGPEIILSRGSPEFVRRLFELEVSEIADKTVEIKGLAREAGFRTKMAVHSNDDKVDPVGACVGMKGSRVKNIVRELSGEKVDIIRWYANIRDFVAEALKPAKIKKIDLDESGRRVVVRLAAEDLAAAVGKRGQNARLTSKLVGWHVAIERDESTDVAFAEQMRAATVELARRLDVPEKIAAALVACGLNSVEAIQEAQPSDLAAVEGITADQGRAIHQIALRLAPAAPAAETFGAAAPAESVSEPSEAEKKDEAPSA